MFLNQTRPIHSHKKWQEKRTAAGILPFENQELGKSRVQTMQLTISL